MGFINIGVSTHYSNVNSLSSRPNMSPSKPEQYLESLESKGIIFAEQNGLYNWTEKKLLLEEKGYKYGHAVHLNVANSLKKSEAVGKLLLIAKNHNGVKEINRLVGDSYEGRNEVNDDETHNFHYVPRTSIDALEELSKDIIVVFSGTENPLWLHNRANRDLELNKWMKFLDADRPFYLGVTSIDTNEASHLNKFMAELSVSKSIPLLAVNDTMSHASSYEYIRFLLNKSSSNGYEQNQKLFMQTESEVRDGLSQSLSDEKVNEAISNTQVVYDSIEEFKLDRSLKYPHLFENPNQRMAQLVKEGYVERGIDKLPLDTQKVYQERIRHELEDVMAKQGSIEYMLLENYLKSEMAKRGIYPSPGRGSAAASLVGYFLHVTDVDPIKENLTFSRFMNIQRLQLADIDSDWNPSSRGEVQAFLLEHPKLKSAGIITYGKFSIKSSLRAIGRALDYSAQEISSIASQVDDYKAPYKVLDSVRDEHSLLFDYSDMIEGVISHSSRHPAAILVSDVDIFEEIGTVRVSKYDYPVTNLSMEYVEYLNFVKLDILGLINWEWVTNAVELAGLPRMYSQSDYIDYEDWSVIEDIATNSTGTIFQLEAQPEATQAMLSPETIRRVREYNPDITPIQVLSILTAAIRPGAKEIRDDVISGKYMDYHIPEIQEVMKLSYGHLVFQEQQIELIQLAGFTGGEADVIRRAVGKKKKDVIDNWIPEFKDKLYDLIITNHPDADKDNAKNVVELLSKNLVDSADYAFNLAHSVVYSTVSYQTAWLRKYHPLEWLTAGYRLWSEDMNESKRQKIATLNKLAKDRGIKIDRAKYRKSKAHHFFDSTGVIYEGIKQIKGMNEKVADYLYDSSFNEDGSPKQFDSFVHFLLDITDPFDVYYSSGTMDHLDLLCNSNSIDDFKAIDKEVKEAEKSGTRDSYVSEDKYEDLQTPNLGQMQALIRLGYFDEFGGSLKLEKIFDFFKKKYNKSNKTLASKAKNIRLVMEYADTVEDEQYSLYDKANYELQYLEKCTIQDSRIPSQYAVVTKIHNVRKNYASVHVHSINKGVGTDVKIGIKLYRNVPVIAGDIIEIQSSGVSYKNVLIDGKWQKSTTEKEMWINQMKYVRKGSKDK